MTQQEIERRRALIDEALDAVAAELKRIRETDEPAPSLKFIRQGDHIFSARTLL